MEFGQKFGVGLLMIVPAFVGGGLWYDVFHNGLHLGSGLSFIPVLVWCGLMAGLAGAITSGKFSKNKPEEIPSSNH